MLHSSSLICTRERMWRFALALTSFSDKSQIMASFQSDLSKFTENDIADIKAVFSLYDEHQNGTIQASGEPKLDFKLTWFRLFTILCFVFKFQIWEPSCAHWISLQLMTKSKVYNLVIFQWISSLLPCCLLGKGFLIKWFFVSTQLWRPNSANTTMLK